MRQAAMKLDKHVFEMSDKELMHELKKRHLPLRSRIGKTEELNRRLREHLENDDFYLEQQKQGDEKLSSGWCRRFAKKNNIKIPRVRVITALVNRYIPVNVL